MFLLLTSVLLLLVRRAAPLKPWIMPFVRSSGSTAICAQLNAQADIVCHDEYIRSASDFQSALKLKRLEQALKNSNFNKSRVGALAALKRAAFPNLAIGFKQKAEQLWPLAVSLCAKHNTQFVFLHRRRLVEHTISVIRKSTLIRRLAARGKVVRFHTNHNNQSRTLRARRWRQSAAHSVTNTGSAKLEPIPIIWSEFVTTLDELLYQKQVLLELRRMVPHRCVLDVNYEDFVRFPVETLREIVKHINGSAQGMSLGETTIEKSSPSDYRNGILNFDELKAKIDLEMPNFEWERK